MAKNTDLNSKTQKQLYIDAKKAGLDVTTRTKKADLIAAMEKAQPSKPKKTVAKKTATKKKALVSDAPFHLYDEGGKKFVPAEKAKAVKVPGFDDFQFFLHKSADGMGWTISEATSGGRILVGRTQKEAKEKAVEALGKHGKEGLAECIKRYIARNGAAPGSATTDDGKGMVEDDAEASVRAAHAAEKKKKKKTPKKTAKKTKDVAEKTKERTEKVKRPKVFGKYSATSAIRGMKIAGLSHNQVVHFFESRGIPVNPSTVKSTAAGYKPETAAQFTKQELAEIKKEAN